MFCRDARYKGHEISQLSKTNLYNMMLGIDVGIMEIDESLVPSESEC